MESQIKFFVGKTPITSKIILAPMDGVVKAVYVKNGDAVPKEGLLIEMK